MLYSLIIKLRDVDKLFHRNTLWGIIAPPRKLEAIAHLAQAQTVEGWSQQFVIAIRDESIHREEFFIQPRN
jgi:hypothetical protein